MLPDDEYYPALLRKYRYPNVDTVEKECEYFFGDTRVTEEQFNNLRELLKERGIDVG